MDHTEKKYLSGTIGSLSLTLLLAANGNAALVIHDQAGPYVSSRTPNILHNLIPIGC